MYLAALSQVTKTQHTAIVLSEVISQVILIRQAAPRLLGKTLQAIITQHLVMGLFFLTQRVLLTQQSGWMLFKIMKQEL